MYPNVEATHTASVAVSKTTITLRFCMFVWGKYVNIITLLLLLCQVPQAGMGRRLEL